MSPLLPEPYQPNRFSVLCVAGLFIIINITTIFSLLKSGHGVTFGWGIGGRIVMPLVFYFGAWRSNNKYLKFISILWGTSILIYFNSVIFRNDPRLALGAIVLGLLMNVSALYLAIALYRPTVIQNGSSFSKSWRNILIFTVFFLLMILLWYFRGLVNDGR